MSAHDLFVRFKLSKRLVEDFIKPTLLVGLFKPPEELSALVVMELFFYYALGSNGGRLGGRGMLTVRKGRREAEVTHPIHNPFTHP
jgi:hypothetical protein